MTSSVKRIQAALSNELTVHCDVENPVPVEYKAQMPSETFGAYIVVPLRGCFPCYSYHPIRPYAYLSLHD